MRAVSFRPSLTLSGRTFKGLRGWSGKPTHPPLTDVPVAAYTLAAVFDAASMATDGTAARDLYRSATLVLIAGVAVSVFAAVTGLWDWLKSTEKGTQARRTVNAHAWMMVAVTATAAASVVVRLAVYPDSSQTPAAAVTLTAVVAVLTFLGATIGGSLVFDYGFNVETGGDHPVWHRSERDVLPGEHHVPSEPSAVEAGR